MKKTIISFCFIISAFYSITLNSQTTISIPLSQGNGEDAYLADGTPNTNFGTHPSIGGNTWTCGGNLCLSRGLFKFDLSSIPAGATITNATLQLYADLNWSSTPTTGGPNNTGYLMRVTSPWSESTVTWNSQPTTTSVNQIQIAGSSSTAQNYTLNVQGLVQDMITNQNYGFMLKMQDEVNYYKSLMFASSDNSNTSKCPVLTLTYLVGTTTTDTIKLCQGNAADAYLADGTPNSNFGSHPSIGGNTWTCSGNLCLSRGLFKFDMSSIPSGATVTNATLQLFADLNWSSTPTTGGPNNNGLLMRVTSPWLENTVTWNTQPSTTSVNQVSIPASTSSAQNYTLNVSSLVQDMITNPNYGFMLKMSDEVNYYKSLMFASSNNPNSSKCPVLTVSYSVSNGISELINKAKMSIYPNPFDDILNIQCSVDMEKIVICDVLGHIVFEENVFGKNYIFKSELSNGIYFISIFGAQNNLISSQKITKCN